MFKTKYTVTLLDSKWNRIGKNISMSIIPRRDEYIFLDDQYYEVLNVIHMFGKRQDIFVVINAIPNKIHFKNFEVDNIEK